MRDCANDLQKRALHLLPWLRLQSAQWALVVELEKPPEGLGPVAQVPVQARTLATVEAAAVKEELAKRSVVRQPGLWLVPVPQAAGVAHETSRAMSKAAGTGYAWLERSRSWLERWAQELLAHFY